MASPFQNLITGLQAPAYKGSVLDRYQKPATSSSSNMTSATTKQSAVGSIRTASPGATSTMPTKIATPVSQAVKSPAAQQFVDTQMQTAPQQSPNYDQLESIKQQALGIQSKIQNPTFDQNADGTVTQAKQRTEKPEKSSYQQAMDSYLSSLKTSQDIGTKYDRESLQATRDYNNELDRPGGSQRGNQMSAALSNRRADSSLSETAYQSKVATDASNLALKRLDYEQGNIPEAFSLSAGQQRYAFNPETGKTELIASGGEDTPNPTASIQEYQFAKNQGYTGTFDEFKNSGGAANNPNAILTPTEAQALGVPYGTTRGAAAGMGITPTKPLTETQARDLTYGTRGQEANTIIDQLSNQIIGMNPATYALYSGIEPNVIGNAAVPNEIRQVKQAQRNFLTAVLRRESGASISPSEFSVAERQYFPRPGDDAQTLAQKAQNRSTAINSFLQNAGQSGVQWGGDPSNPFSANNFFGG